MREITIDDTLDHAARYSVDRRGAARQVDWVSRFRICSGVPAPALTRPGKTSPIIWRMQNRTPSARHNRTQPDDGRYALARFHLFDNRNGHLASDWNFHRQPSARRRRCRVVFRASSGRDAAWLRNRAGWRSPVPNILVRSLIRNAAARNGTPPVAKAVVGADDRSHLTLRSGSKGFFAIRSGVRAPISGGSRRPTSVIYG